MNRSYQRRNYFIKKEFQTKFIIKFCVLLLLGVIISTILLFAFSQDTLTSSFQHSQLVIKQTGLAILPSIVYTNLITFALISIATIIVTLFVSHKIAGPLLRLEKELKIIGNGDLTGQVKLRKLDQITDLADCLNNTAASLRVKVAEIRTEVEEIQQSAANQEAIPALHEKLIHLQKTIEKSFKL